MCLTFCLLCITGIFEIMISHAYLLTHKDILRICCRFVGFHWLIESAIFDFRLNQRKRYIFSSMHLKKLTLVFGRTGILM